MRNSVTIKHVIKPVSLCWLHKRRGKSKGSVPFKALGAGAFLSKGKLTGIRIPRSDQMDLLDMGGGFQRKR